jgi:hypothetical protein
MSTSKYFIIIICNKKFKVYIFFNEINKHWNAFKILDSLNTFLKIVYIFFNPLKNEHEQISYNYY